MKIRRPRLLWKLALLTLALAALPATSLADGLQPATRDQLITTTAPFGGTIELQPGAVNGQVTLEPGSASLQATLRDPGVDGNLQVTVPGQFVGQASASGGALSYDLAACGPGVSISLSGTSSTSVHFGFQDTASHPDACAAPPATSAVDQTLVMSPLMLAQAQPTASTTDVQSFLVDWLRRLVGLSLLAALLVLVIPALPRALSVATETSPWGRIGIGVAVALILPLVGILLFAIGLPVGLWWLGVILLALYPVLLLVSLSVSGLSVGSWLSQHLGRPGVPILLVFAIGMLALSFVSLLPYVGPILNIVAVAFGLGTLLLAPRSGQPATLDPTSGLQPPAPESEVTSGPVTSEPVAA